MNRWHWTGIALLITVASVFWIGLGKRSHPPDPAHHIAEPESAHVVHETLEAAATTESRRPYDETARRVRASYGINLDRETKLRLIGELVQFADPVQDAVAVLNLAMDDPDEMVRMMALHTIASNMRLARQDIGEIIKKGLGDPDPGVFGATMDLLSSAGIRRYPVMIWPGFIRPDYDERHAAMNLIAVPDTSVPLVVYQAALQSPYPDVRARTIAILTHQADARAIPVIVEALRDASDEVRREAGHALFFLLGQSFRSYEEARAFWTQNQHRYSGSLLDYQADEMDSDFIDALDAAPRSR